MSRREQVRDALRARITERTLFYWGGLLADDPANPTPRWLQHDGAGTAWEVAEEVGELLDFVTLPEYLDPRDASEKAFDDAYEEPMTAQEAPAPDGLTPAIHAFFEAEYGDCEHYDKGSGAYAACEDPDSLVPVRALPLLLAEEAPAPEGLLAAVRPLIEHRVGLYSLAAEKVGMNPEWAMAVIEDRDPYLAKAVAAIRAAAPPSPAEPPRPDHQHHYEHDFRCGTCGATFLAVLTDDRAEARPPEGLDPAWAAAEAALPEGMSLLRVDFVPMRAKYDEELYRAHAEWWTAGGSKADRLAADADGPTPATALHVLAARLSARGAEPR